MKKFGKVIVILFLTVFLLYFFLISSILNLTNKKDLHTINLTGAFEILEVEHTINVLIPVGKDYYYIGIENETYDAYIIKASKKWLEKNFDTDYMAKDAGGLRITALAGKVQDSSISWELQSRAESIEGLNYPLGTEYCLNIKYKTEAILRLLVVVLCAILIITELPAVKHKWEGNSLFSKFWLAGLLIALLLMVKCLFMRS